MTTSRSRWMRMKSVGFVFSIIPVLLLLIIRTAESYSIGNIFNKRRRGSEQRAPPEEKNRVIITPPPPESDDDDNDDGDGKQTGTINIDKETTGNNNGPNWIFIYPEPCTRLFPIGPNGKSGGASVGDFATNIPPDSCQGGYYGHDESLNPEDVLRDGLPQRGDDWDLLRHAEQQQQKSGSDTLKFSAFRGTTKQIVYPEDGVGAAAFAGEGGYVYELTCVPSWDVNKHLQGRRKQRDEWIMAASPANQRFGGNLAMGEHEFAVSSRVPTEHIKRYGKVVQSASGILFVPRSAWIENPNWNPDFCRYSASDFFCVE